MARAQPPTPIAAQCFGALRRFVCDIMRESGGGSVLWLGVNIEPTWRGKNAPMLTFDLTISKDQDPAIRFMAIQYPIACGLTNDPQPALDSWWLPVVLSKISCSSSDDGRAMA